MFWKTSGSKKEAVMGDWSRLHNEELPDVYSSTTVIQVIRSRAMSWGGHVAYMG
jgi:hypothetical protein